ncbi:MAG: DUF1700 domain-containing protein [Eubacteriales bacterium]
MNKQDFLSGLSAKLASLPKHEIEKSISYYEEIIDDRIEDNMSEEDAVAALGDLETIANNIMYDMSIPALMKAKVSESKNKASNKTVWLVLVILGFPLWFPLLMTFPIVFLSLYFSVWAIIVSLYAVVFSLGLACIAGLGAGFVSLFTGTLPSGIAALGIALCLGAVTLFMIKPVYLITLELIKFTAFVLRKIKSLFIEKRG